ncbi:hypothetical protein O181_066987 [Austropuccinia psidii MF-1]|uniref:Uncharacterized protein n=1 Tax=Austropuccinia psidii MF-1 TaxID=1389203 RepID=A0A9Q3EWG9_9BASI|nr:hypothetical protein [Austropuccinia psidii MF-1]
MHNKSFKGHKTPPCVSVEERFLPPEARPQGSPPVTPPGTDPVEKGKAKRYSEVLISNKELKPIATWRIQKPQILASKKFKPTLIACNGRIKIINPLLASKDKFPKRVDLRNLEVRRNQAEDRAELVMTRTPGFGQHCGWQDTL